MTDPRSATPGTPPSVRGLRLLVFDTTCRSAWAPGLSTAWSLGARLYRGLGRLDVAFGARTWAEALEFLATFGAPAPIDEVQFWGHGTFGCAWIAKDRLGIAELEARAYTAALDTLAGRLGAPHAGREPLVWLRTCESFGGRSGQAFARALSRRLGCRVAGHTHVIGVLQSGLVTLAPGSEPAWPESMGLGPEGEAGPGLPSSPGAPNTVHFLTGRVPPTRL